MSRPKTIGIVALAALFVSACALYLSGVIPYKVFVVRTGSMGNTIPSRSAVFDRTDSNADLQVGDVITFRVHGTTETHRIYAIASDGTITTKGDANRTVDPWTITKRDVRGRVVMAPRWLGWWIVFVLQTPTGALSFILFALAFWQCWNLPKAFEPEKPRAASATV